MIAIIPARGGSKGLPGKNIKNLLGKPLISYTIEAALKSEEITRVIVSTDSKEIADISLEYGAEVPFLRPITLAMDDSSAIDVYIHAVEYLKATDNENIEKFMVLLPTAPLRDYIDIDRAVKEFKSKNASTLVSMKKAEVPVSWYYKLIDEKGRVQNAGFDYKNAILNRQANEQYYIPNGAIYILDYKLLKEKRTYYDENTIAFIMESYHSIDIDTQLEFNIVEYLLNKNNYSLSD